MTNEEHTLRTVVIEVISILVLYIIAIFFYHNVEGWGFVDAAYFITSTITTIGYGDITPKTEHGKLFTIALAFIGISLAFLLISTIAFYRKRVIDTHMSKRLSLLKTMTELRGRRRQMENRGEDIIRKIMPK